MLPGLSATMAIALLTGLTYNLPTQSALISLLGVYVGSISGGCQSAILLNIPRYSGFCSYGFRRFSYGKSGKRRLCHFSGDNCVVSRNSVERGMCYGFYTSSDEYFLKIRSMGIFPAGYFGIVICGSLTSREIMLLKDGLLVLWVFL